MMNQQPRTWAESLLVAYVDGQLDATQTKQVEEALRDDPEARAIVSVLRSSAADVKHAYDEALDRPLPESLRRLFEDAGESAAAATNVVSLPAHPSLVRRLLPLAASVAALMIGFGAGYATFGDRSGRFYVSAGEGDESADLFQAALQQALEATGPDASQDYASEAQGISGKVTVIGPVTTANLGSCREFRHDAVSNGATAASFGLACRDSHGNWLVEVETPAGG